MRPTVWANSIGLVDLLMRRVMPAVSVKCSLYFVTVYSDIPVAISNAVG